MDLYNKEIKSFLQMVVRKRHADVVKILIRIKEAILYG